MSLTLGYWDIRGLGEFIRYLLHYKGVEFEDKRYSTFDEWMNQKFNLGLDFPNLPYLIDGDVRITQSVTIIRYLARKYGLDAKSEKDRLRLEVAEQQVIDLRRPLGRTAYTTIGYEKAKEELLESIPKMLETWSQFLGHNKFVLGDQLSYVDFMLYETFDFYELFSATVFDDFPKLKEYQRRFERIPEIQRYMKSSGFKRWPIFMSVASFGGSGEEPKKVP